MVKEVDYTTIAYVIEVGALLIDPLPRFYTLLSAKVSPTDFFVLSLF